MNKPVGYVIGKSTTKATIVTSKAIASTATGAWKGLARFGRNLKAGYIAARNDEPTPAVPEAPRVIPVTSNILILK